MLKAVPSIKPPIVNQIKVAEQAIVTPGNEKIYRIFCEVIERDRANWPTTVKVAKSKGK